MEIFILICFCRLLNIRDDYFVLVFFKLFQYAILGFALTEAVGLLGLMMAFLLLFM